MNFIEWNWQFRKVGVFGSWKGSENKVIIHLPSSKGIPERAGSIVLQVPSAALTNHCRGSEFSIRAFQTKSLRFPLGGCDPQTAVLLSHINQHQHKYRCLFSFTPGILSYSGGLKFGSEAWLSFLGVWTTLLVTSWPNLDQFQSHYLTRVVCPCGQIKFLWKFENLTMILISFLPTRYIISQQFLLFQLPT